MTLNAETRAISDRHLARCISGEQAAAAAAVTKELDRLVAEKRARLAKQEASKR